LLTQCLETPILDRQQPVPTVPLPRHLNRLSPAFLGVVAMALLLTTVLVPVVIALLVCLLAHEVGHLIAGLVVRWEFRYFLAGPFAVWKQSDGLKLRFVPRKFFSGGQVLMVPKGPGWSRRNQIIGIAGGPIMTALMFIPVIILPWSQFTTSLAAANVLIAVGSWIPFVLAGQATDARLLIRFAKAPSVNFAAIAELWALDYAGVLPSNWPPALVNQVGMAAGDLAFRSVAGQFWYLYLRECGDGVEAAAALESVLARAAELSPDERRSYFSEAAFFQAMFRNSSVLAREWLEEARKVDAVRIESDWENYPLAAIAVVEGDTDAARSYIVKAIAALDRHPGHSGTVASARARLVALMT